MANLFLVPEIDIFIYYRKNGIKYDYDGRVTEFVALNKELEEAVREKITFYFNENLNERLTYFVL